MASIFASIKNAVADAKATPIEKKVRACTSSDNWPVTNTAKAEVAMAARTHQGCREVMPIIWEKLDSASKEWRVIVKTLELLEVMVRLSSERVVDEARENSRAISRLVDFHYSEDGRDRGAGIREKSKYLMDLLTDRDKLNEVRAQARENQTKCVAISSDGSARGSMQSVAYNDDPYESAFTNGGYDTPVPKPVAAKPKPKAGAAAAAEHVKKAPAKKAAAPPPKAELSGDDEPEDDEDADTPPAKPKKKAAAATNSAAKPKKAAVAPKKKIALEMDEEAPSPVPVPKRAVAPVQPQVPVAQPQYAAAAAAGGDFDWASVAAPQVVQQPVRAQPQPQPQVGGGDGFDVFDPRGVSGAPAQPVVMMQQPVRQAAVEWDPFTGAAAAPVAAQPKQPMQIPVDLFDRPAVPASTAAAVHDADFGDFKSAEPTAKPAAKKADALWDNNLIGGGGTFSLTSTPASKPVAATGPAKPSMAAMKGSGPSTGGAGGAAGGGVGDYFFSGSASAVAPLYPAQPQRPAGNPMGMGMPMGGNMNMGMGMGMGMPMGMPLQPMNPYAQQAQQPMMPALLPVRQQVPAASQPNNNAANFFF